MDTRRTNPKRALLLLIGGAVALAAVAYLFLRGAGDGLAERTKPAASRESGPADWETPPATLEPTTLERPAGVGLLPGDVITWSFRQDRSMTMEVASPRPGAEAQQSRLENHRTGSFRLIVLASRGPRYVGRLQIVEAQDTVVSSEIGTPPQETDLGKLLSRGASVVLGRDGRIEKLVFDASLGALARRAWKSILAEWQVSWPADPEAREWPVREVDETGPYTARYEVLSGPGESPRRVKKTRQAYEEIRAAGEAVQGAHGESGGETEFLLDPLLLRADGNTEADLALPGTRVRARHDFSYLRTGHRREAPGEAESIVAAILAAEGTTLAEAEQGVDRFEGEPAEVFDESVRDLDICHGGGRERSPEAIEAAERLTEALRRDPALVERLLGIIGGWENRPGLATRLVMILAQAATETAQSGLADLIVDLGRAPAIRRAAIHGTVSLDAPSPALEAALVRDIERGSDFGPDSLLVLGAVGFKVREAAPERAAGIERRILTRLDRAPSTEERIDALDAVGNLGPTAIPEGVRRALEDEDEEVRGAAFRALVRIPVEEARTLLLGALGTDSDPSVRVEAIRALARREYALEKPDPGLPALLREVIEKEPSSEVRDAAKATLQQRGQ